MNKVRSILKSVPYRRIARFRRQPVWMMADEGTLKRLLLSGSGISAVNRYRLMTRLRELREVDEVNERMSSARTCEESRWEEEESGPEGPDYPVLSVSSSKRVQLPDGRMAERIGKDLARPLCGLREPVRPSQIPKRLYDRIFMKCHGCGGFHIEKKRPHSVSGGRSPILLDSSFIILCAHCKSAALEYVFSHNAIHCITCGWYGFFRISSLSEEEREHNEAAMPLRYVEEKPEEDEELGENMEEDEEDIEEDEEESDRLFHGLYRLWTERQLRKVRNQLIEESVLKQLRPFLWAAVIDFIMDGTIQNELVPFLSCLSDEDLADYAGFESEEEEEEFASLLERKLENWRGAIRTRIGRFRSKAAGIRIIGRKFHPNPAVLQAVVG